VSDESVVINADGIRAVFQRENQRWIHQIELSDNSGNYEVVMRSLEGAADNAWPPSPVIQEIEVPVKDGVIRGVIGLGMSGSVHWSMSCYPAPHPVARWARIESLIFEAAGRVQGAFERIGTCYHVVPEIAATELDQGIVYRCRAGQWYTTANAGVISNMNQTLRIDVFDEELEPSARTVQWAYAINRINSP
jgi:hypothetical protein